MGWPVDHMSMASSARKRDRGATFVEYALVVAVFTTVLVGAFDVLTRSAGDELASTGDSIGTPYIGTSAGATSTSVPAGPGGSPTTTTPATSTTLSPTTTIRSEEHTSELQSLMRISYAVFCLKKKNKQAEKE